MSALTKLTAAHVAWRRWLLALYAASIVTVCIQKGFLRADNNFAIFRASFGNLLAGRDMYAPHPEQYVDLYKYSPTFAVLFAPLAVSPLPLAILIWSALNAGLLWYAVSKLLADTRGTLALALLYFEVLRNMQRAQSNSLVAALVVLAFLAFERRRQLGAAVAIGVGAMVKIFPLAALAFALLHPRRVRFALLFAGVMVVLAALPLLFVSPHQLAAQYASWHHREMVDALTLPGPGGGAPYGGVMEQLRIWLGVTWPNWPIQLAGTVLLLLPLALRRREWEQYEFRLRFLCSLLLYLVVFNHMVESPTFVIGVTGIAIWYVSSPRTRTHTALMAFTILFVSLSSTEITPHRWQQEFFVAYKLKTIPCVLVWLVMQAELLGLLPRASGEHADARQLDAPAAEAGVHS